MSLVFRNALMPSENQQVLRLRLAYLMRKKILITLFSLFAISGSLFSPAKSHQIRRNGFGEGTAAFACFLLWEGFSKNEIESLISRFAWRIENSDFSEREMNQMASGYREQVRITRNCNLRMRY